MTDYHVTWEMDVYADSPEEAAHIALTAQRDPKGSATVFDVRDPHGFTARVDLGYPRDAQL